MQNLLHFAVAWILSRWIDEQNPFLESECPCQYSPHPSGSVLHLAWGKEGEHHIKTLTHFSEKGDSTNSLLRCFSAIAHSKSHWTIPSRAQKDTVPPLVSIPLPRKMGTANPCTMSPPQTTSAVGWLASDGTIQPPCEGPVVSQRMLMKALVSQALTVPVQAVGPGLPLNPYCPKYLSMNHSRDQDSVLREVHRWQVIGCGQGCIFPLLN